MSAKKLLLGLLAAVVAVLGYCLKSNSSPDREISEQMKQLNSTKEIQYVADRAICT
jgi:hypothetical protein